MFACGAYKGIKLLTHRTAGGRPVAVVDQLNKAIHRVEEEELCNSEGHYREKKCKSLSADCDSRCSLQQGWLQERQGLGKLLIFTWSYSVKNLSKHEESTAKPRLLLSGSAAGLLEFLSI